MFFVLLFNDNREWMITQPAWHEKELAKEKARQIASFHRIKLNKRVKVVEIFPFPYARKISDFKLKTIKVEK